MQRFCIYACRLQQRSLQHLQSVNRAKSNLMQALVVSRGCARRSCGAGVCFSALRQPEQRPQKQKPRNVDASLQQRRYRRVPRKDSYTRCFERHWLQQRKPL